MTRNDKRVNSARYGVYMRGGGLRRAVVGDKNGRTENERWIWTSLWE